MSSSGETTKTLVATLCYLMAVASCSTSSTRQQYVRESLPPIKKSTPTVSPVAASTVSVGTSTCWIERGPAKTVACWRLHKPPARVHGLSSVVEITAGYHHACARLQDETVVCWGLNESGQLGDGTDHDTRVPTKTVNLSNVVQIAAGGWHTCALRRDGGVYCWGSFIPRTRAGSRRPMRMVGIDDAIQVSCGDGHTCALRRNRTVVCWGSNPDFGIGRAPMVGNGRADGRGPPREVVGFEGIREVSSGGSTICAIVADGRVLCLGDNHAGQLGDGTQRSRSTPRPVVGLKDVVQVAPSGFHTCALRRDGSVACWGRGAMGALGDGTLERRKTPVLVHGLSDAVEISTMTNVSCARDRGGEVSCWGNISPVVVPAEKLENEGNLSCARRRDGKELCWGNTPPVTNLANAEPLRGSKPQTTPLRISKLSSVSSHDL